MTTTRLRRIRAVCALTLSAIVGGGCSDSATENERPDPPQVVVLVRFEGDGAGRVHSPNSAAPVDCSSATTTNTCATTFTSPGAFELLATPSTGSTFVQWACSANQAAPTANCSECTGAGECKLSTACCGDVTITVVARFQPVGAATIAQREAVSGPKS